MRKVKTTKSNKAPKMSKTTGTKLNLPTTNWSSKPCKKHDPVSECGSCGTLFWLIPKDNPFTNAKNNKQLIKLIEKEIEEWVKLLIKLKK